jgi:hypothetical protein
MQSSSFHRFAFAFGRFVSAMVSKLRGTAHTKVLGRFCERIISRSRGYANREGIMQPFSFLEVCICFRTICIRNGFQIAELLAGKYTGYQKTKKGYGYGKSF